MRNFSKYLSLTALTGVLSFGGAMSINAGTNLKIELPMDLTRVTDVHVSGSNTQVTFFADPSLPTGVTVLDHGGKNCKMVPTMTREGKTMLIVFDLRKGGFGFVNPCQANIAINLIPGANLDITLDKLVTTIHGAYGTINVQAEEAVLNFDGQATQIDINGDNVVATIVLNNVEVTDHIRVNASKLVFDLGLSESAQVSYQINAKVALFSRGIRETANAATKIEISADVLKGSTYVNSSAL